MPLPRPFAAACLGVTAVALLAATGAARERATRRAPSQRAASEGVWLRAPGSKEVLIRGGTFLMGSGAHEVVEARMQCELEPRRRDCEQTIFANELVPHQVMLSDYWIDRMEVNNRDYQRCVEVGECLAPGYSAAQQWRARADYPATLVSWYDAERYCRWRGGRLPTEAEWERAARGWSARRYPWGEVFNPRIVNHGRFAVDPLSERDGFAELAPVGSFPQGRTLEGVHDLAGNVEEWVADWYAPSYPEADEVDPKGPAHGDERVLRGGSFRSGRAWLRGAARAHELPSVRRAWIGFRCARPGTRRAP
jgi:formylglycine-generating enzyme required for sulfatase activity